MARALGQVPHGFDLSATIFTPRTRRLGGLGGLGTMSPYQITPLQPAALREASVQPSPLISASVRPPGTSPGFTPPPIDFTGSGIPTAGDRVGDARRSQEPSAPPAGGYLPEPDVHIDDAMTPPDDFIAPTFRNGVRVTPRETKSGGWPWYIWAMIAAGVGTGVYALTRR